ncbi:MAG: cation diffusion facilitator family transporter [Anaerolineae bacterium]|nr:cation diffusion facilitator family transporter [Anaerolineae bacterium]
MKDDRRRQVSRVLWMTLAANLGVSGGKLAVGLLTGTLSMVADGFHSALDASSNVIGLAGNAIAGRPPDDDHPYGHRRFETIAAMAVGALLLLTAWEIAGSAIERLQAGGEPEVTPLNFIVMLVTIGINLAVSRYERAAGKRLGSEVLLADAANTGADVFVSLSVLLSLAAVAIGWLWADVVAALVVVVLIARAAWGVLWQTGRVLVDTAPLDPAEVEQVVMQIPGVLAVERVRSRGSADAMLLDIDVRVDAALTTERAQTITGAIDAKLREAFDGIAEVEVHHLPYYEMPPDYGTVARAEAEALGLSVHELVLYHTPAGLALEMHIEVPPHQMLEDAHYEVSIFENRLKAQLPHIPTITTHIEPAHQGPVPLTNSARAEDVRDQAAALALELYPDVDWHDVFIRPEAHGYALAMHGGLAEDMTVEDAHLLAERTETHLRASLPLLQRVTIHTEPRHNHSGG